jgi:hypothetical protein
MKSTVLFFHRQQTTTEDNMNTYNVFFEGIFWGYAWADTAWEAIQKVAGEDAYDTTGARDYRWSVDLFA